MTTQPIELVFPAAGVVRRIANAAGFGDGPTPTPWAVNVRLEDTLTKRLRGGSFEGLEVEDIPLDNPRFFEDSDGNNITDDSGNTLYFDGERSVAGSGGRLLAIPGPDAPDEHPAEVIYRGRLLRPDGAAIFASRQGDYADWDYGADVDDQGRAFVIQLSEAGEIGGDVVALVPHKDAYLLAATSDSLWVVSGDPTANGMMRNVSRGVGMVSARAWCKDHMDRVYFLSSHGLYTVGADGQGLQAVSEGAIPVELTGIENEDTVLAYNHADRGVYIHLPGDTLSFFFDTERQGFWPFTLDSSDSHVLFGPVKLGSIDQNGVINSIHGMVAAGSAAVTWRIITGETAEEAADNGKAAIAASLSSSSFSNYVKYSGSWTAGRSLTVRPRVRGMWACIWLQSAGQWAFERMTMQIASAGAWRD